MEENTFWLRLWGIVCVAFVVFMVSISSCTINRNMLVADMAKNGVDPLEARMAVSNDYSDSTFALFKK